MHHPGDQSARDERHANRRIGEIGIVEASSNPMDVNELGSELKWRDWLEGDWVDAGYG